MAGEKTLPSLLLPGTPQDVAEKYLSLAERAQGRDFGPLEDEVVVLDTETTGLSFKDCDLIEISAALLRGREVVDRFETFVHPGGPIPPEITLLTGISNADVTDAPSARDAVAALAEFVAGRPVLAHNATFDRTFIEGVPGGAEVSDTWIDTLSLSRIALPRLSSHRLADMASAFGCASVTHRAGDDVDALCGMWRVLLTALSDLPQGLLAQLAGMHPEVDWSFRPLLSYLAGEKDPEPFSLKALRAQLVRAESGEQRVDAMELDHVSAPSADEIRAAFEPGGVVSRMYEHMECRPEQVEMALEVRDALATSTHRAIEAGTGVGKSVAYLLPEVLFAQRNNVTVGIATKTNALTDQLVSHELPALAAALPGGLTFTSLKGYDHYPCLHRLDRAALEELPLAVANHDGRSDNAVACDMLTAIAVTYAFACQSSEGDLDALGIRWRYVPRQMLTTTSGECLRGRCPYFPNECLLHGARRRAARGDVVVTNHSLLLRDVEAEGRILPPVRHWVIDEAHAFEAEARRQWAVEVSGDEARGAFELLGGTRTGAIHAAMVQAMPLEGSTLAVGLLTKAAAVASRAATAVADLFVAVHGLTAIAHDDGGYDTLTLWIDEQVRSTPEWGELRAAAGVCEDALDEAVRAVAEAAGALTDELPQVAASLSESARFLKDLLAGIVLIAEGSDRRYVYSAQLSRSKRRLATERLVAEKIDVGADLAERWLPETKSAVFTSATIAVSDDFSHFEQAVGLSALPAATRRDVRLSSSFDYDAHMSVVVAGDLPAPNDRAYLGALEDLLYDVHVAMGGSVLTLFTNRRDMERVYEGLRPRLAAAGLELACQERGSSPRRLRTRFMAEKTLSLLALRSFWEGFDATGDTLRCVVIPKLPFASPNDPLVRERDLREDRAWWRYSLPEAVISVKQAAGRLIRSATDVGVLVLADSRVVSKGYGRLFVSSLPSGNVSRLESANVGRYIRMWRASHE
ncbi:helicase C-terminal domain-containing protein [Thermophilibacter provencensis]|uniref:Helicase C-terminal domain-containing protein n=1 Tax=Thermophilibacter provencensis TaxID=1852386 RepID=A0ABT7V2I9_9ACTN|nr:helicase C-terminal domain-containing protein [Thermophilibacter provencensis]MDM8270825.1 helicase C-terminal domain-containing protein [Thermophilibacter provencensis]